MDSWILCTERMPKREQSSAFSDWLLVTVDLEGACITWFAHYRFIDRTWWDLEGQQTRGVTAWRELPEPFEGTIPRQSAAAAG
jgi:hypothetical protein